jgi:hypothetical protein
MVSREAMAGIDKGCPIATKGALLMTWFQSVYYLVLDLPARRSVEAIMVALFLAGMTAGLYRLLRRGKTDTMPLLTGLILISNLFVMIIAAATVRYSFAVSTRMPYTAPMIMPAGPMGDPRSRSPLAERLFHAADEDHNQRVTPDEAARAASRFVHDADVLRENSVDLDAFDAAVKRSSPRGRR